MQHSYLAAEPAPRVLAHRGLVTPEMAAAGIVENTLAAFEAAAGAGSDYLESDVHLSADGAAVLFHDEDLSRVAGDPRRVAELSRNELATIMADRGGLLTLDEILERFPNKRFNIDVKVPEVASLAGAIVGPHSDRVLLTSFAERSRRVALTAARDASAGRGPATSPGRQGIARILFALASRSRTLQERELRRYDALQIPEAHGRVRVLTPRLIEAAHRYGVEVHVWTVNDPARMTELVQQGVDGIITDRADLALEIFSI